ncbi:exopolyphosphatase [Arcobacter sp. FWKO B]|uniref:Ppx/GppA phosphatase family protein n=1 Tax=Arcobacter sp. FWKO B TaxID=2593672 RepID=UPI0018A6879F|nr:exopolyphosphatase [Arcobacter sp. FWKO B]QOG11699.1 exopolyphosphatase [Arcobacter sp. FWKO B]
MQDYIVSMDLGSNSFRVLKYDCINNQELGEYEKVVATADGLSQSGNISDEAIQRITSAIQESIQKLEFDPTKAICITTAAMRKANNSQDVLNIIEKETGAKFKIIDGDKEAELTLLAIKEAIKRHGFDNKKFLFVDIGGASSELVIVQNDKVFKKSFDFGIVTMSQSLNPDISLENAKNDILNFIQGIDLKDFGFYATAGTPTTLAAIKQGLNYHTYDKHKINGTLISREDLKYYLELFCTLSQEDASTLVGSRKIEFVIMGVKIFDVFYDTLGFENSVVFDDGLKEGIVLDALLMVNG